MEKGNVRKIDHFFIVQFWSPLFSESLEKWENWTNLRFLTRFSIFPFFPNIEKLKNERNVFIRTVFFYFFNQFVQKMKKKIEKSHTYSPIFHNSILIRKIKKWQVLNQWSVPAILHLTKNADYESEKCLKIKVFLCVLHSKPKRMPFLTFTRRCENLRKVPPFLIKSRIFSGVFFGIKWTNFLE